MGPPAGKFRKSESRTPPFGAIAWDPPFPQRRAGPFFFLAAAAAGRPLSPAKTLRATVPTRAGYGAPGRIARLDRPTRIGPCRISISDRSTRRPPAILHLHTRPHTARRSRYPTRHATAHLLADTDSSPRHPARSTSANRSRSSNPAPSSPPTRQPGIHTAHRDDETTDQQSRA